MTSDQINRREFIASLIGGLSVASLDWCALPRGARADTTGNEYDAIIIGSGLGGLSCAAAFARQNFRVLVIEQHNRPGGYATSFKRPGGFEFDVSLHSTVVEERAGVHNLIPGFPEIEEVTFLPHPHLYRLILPDYDIRVPQRDIEGYTRLLSDRFPAESTGIRGLVDDMTGLAGDIRKISAAGGNIDMSTFPATYPHLFKCYSKTWGQMVDAHIRDPQLKAILSALWGYYGLPPSRLAGYYYALPTIGYLENGGYYPRGRSQTISNAFVRFIEEHGGTVLLKKRVEEILLDGQTATGIRTDTGEELRARVVVSNINSFDTFKKLIHDDSYLADYLARMERCSVSLSSFQLFMGLKKDLTRETGITDSEIFVDSGYDIEATYQAAARADVEHGYYGVTIYDNVDPAYSPPGKNTLNVIVLQGFEHWEQFQHDYFAGEKSAYNAEKRRMADILIGMVEERLLPGLRDAIEVLEIATPLTNLRYTSNYRGAIYGWDQTLDNSGPSRIAHTTPINNLYLSGAWTKPGHGYGGVLYSGLECFAEIMKQW